MPNEQELRAEIGHVLFVDLVGYSKRLIDEQSELLEQLKELVRGSEQVRAAKEAGQLIQLATGDGMALVFRNSPEAPAQCALELARMDKQHPELQLRMGIHSGPINEVIDVNDRANVTGAGINLAQRVMDCGDAGHILLSKRAADDLAQYRHWQPRLHDIGEAEVKHGVRLGIVSLHGDGFGNSAVPEKMRSSRPSTYKFPWKGILILLVSLGAVLYGFYLFYHNSPPLRSPVASPEAAPVAAAPARSAIPEKSIAVLPFENLSTDKENAFFADGIQDEILTRLAKIGDLKVISRTSTQRYKSSPDDLPKIAQQLGVAHILEGSVQKAGNQVRVTVQLIAAATDSHLWAESYDRKLSDIFAVESEVAEKIAQSLQARLSGAEQKAVAARPTENPEAYEAYLHGLGLWNRIQTSPKDLENTVMYFSRAVQLDPNFALAWASLSVAQTFTYAEFDRTPQRLAQSKQALDAALRLAPEAGETQFALGVYRYRGLSDYEGALAAFAKARREAASRVEALEFSAYVKRRQGKWDEALALHAQSLELDPRNPILLSEAAQTYRALRRFDEALSLLDRALEIEPNSFNLLILKAEIYRAQGDTETATRLLARVPADGQDPSFLNARLRLWLFLRQYDQAIQVLRPLLVAPENLPQSFVSDYRASLGIAEALAGQREAATSDLSRARDELLALRAQGDKRTEIATDLILIAGFLGDKAALEREAALAQPTIEQEAMDGPGLEWALAVARTQMGEKDIAIANVKHLFAINGWSPLTPALLRLDPLWDPLRSDPRFEKLSHP